MKKVALLIIVLLFTVSCFACTNKQGTASSDSNTSKTGGEQEIIINPGEWQLTGTLTMPDGEGPFPLIVFVHGSGPIDRDETIGKIKVFKDLASDLAKQGIASIRYDKRTYLYGTEMASDYNLTVKEETIDDALSAVLFAKTTERIDSNNIFIAGHSMGGYLIPRIDEADSGNLIAGYISLAGSVRSIMELTIEQIDYIFSLDSALSETEKADQKKQIIDADKMIKGFTTSDKGSNKAVLGAYPTYWLDLADYNPDRQIKNVTKPLLFLQGGNDYQVTTTDFDLWKSALEGNNKAEFKLYPKLTHSFTFTESKGTPNDYQIYTKVDETIAKDITSFINRNIR